MKKNPICILAAKELTVMLQVPATYVIGVVFLLINGWLFAGPLFAMNQSVLDSFVLPIPLLFTFLIPALTMRSFSEEFKSGTIEYLATLPVEDHEIVLGKYLAVLGLVGLLMVFTLSYPLILYCIGRPDTGQIVGAYVAILGLSCFYVAIGLWASALTRNQVVAFIVSFFICFMFYLLNHVATFRPGFLAGFIRSVSVEAHFEALARGVLDSRDLLYWASGSAFFLLASLAAMQSRKWR